MSLLGQISGNVPEYRFYVTLTSLTYEVFPLNFLNTSIKWDQKDGHFFYRSEFNGELTFGSNSTAIDADGNTRNRNSDFELFWDVEQGEPCAKIYLLILKITSGVPDTYWEGYFSTSNGSFDLDKCTFTVTPYTDDIYAVFDDSGGVEYNMPEMSTAAAPDGAGAELTTSMVYDGDTYTYEHNRLLIDVLRYIVNQIVPGTGVVSTFLTEATNPVTAGTNRMRYLFISAMRDIKDPTGAAETKAMISFDDIMNMLGCLNLRWDYDGADVIVEHESYWAATPGGIDTRTMLAAVATNQYSYTQEEMPKYEKFEWQESGVDFAGSPIWYDSMCVNQNKNSNTKTLTFDVTTDLEYIVDNDVDLDGFVLICNSLSGTYSVLSAIVTGTANTKYNAYLAWPNLHDQYFRHGRVLIEGYLNNVLNVFYSALKTKQQGMQISYCDTFNPAEEITTELGETYLGGIKAVVKTAEIDPTGVIKLELLYGPDDLEASGPAADPDILPKLIQIVEEKDIYGLGTLSVRSYFYMTLNQVSDVDLTISIKLNIRSLRYAGCYTSTVSGTIAAGSLTQTITVNWCIQYFASGVYYDPWIHAYIINDTLAPDWDYYLIKDPNSARS